MITAAELMGFAKDNSIHGFGYFRASEFSKYLDTIQNLPSYRKIAYRPFGSFQNAGRIPQGISSVIVLVMDYFISQEYETDELKLSSYFRACWRTLGPKSAATREFLRNLGYQSQDLDLPQRAAACRAGLGFIGKNSMFYAHGLGSYVGIACIGTDAEIENATDAEERVTHPACTQCGKCIAACPTGAINKDGYGIDPLKCISFLNRHPEEQAGVLPESSAKSDGWLIGCEVCQLVCPINRQAKHKYEAIISETLDIYGMTFPNKASIDKAAIEERIAACNSSAYAKYLRLLVGHD